MINIPTSVTEDSSLSYLASFGAAVILDFMCLSELPDFCKYISEIDQ